MPHTQQGQVAMSPHANAPQVHLVDDDAGVRSALARLLDGRGYEVLSHASATGFLDCYEPKAHGCIILDVSMPGVDGFSLQQTLASSGSNMPIIILTGCADVPMCANAMRAGAIDFLTKPVDEALLVGAITRALARHAMQRSSNLLQETTRSRLDSLTPREREVITHVMDGRLNKQIAADLGTAEKTVKVHRARAMEKMHVRSVAELVRMVERARSALRVGA